jgi:TolB-like protein/Tfp pilus assembly protein PilF
MADQEGSAGRAVLRSVAELDPSLIRNQLSRILASEPFLESERMVRFLQFAVDETLKGNAAQLKENVIGTHVFDRPLSYDPRIDPIVRVEARRLRTKLRAYYEGPGKHDSILFEIPKGGYSLVFQQQSFVEHGKSVEPNVITVLPFLNLSADGETDFLSDGFAEELINALTRVPGLCVSAWNSAAQLKGREEDLSAIRRELGAAYVLRGSIRKINNRLRVTAQLIQTDNGRYAWSEIYNREFRDIFSIQEQIATAIVIALRLNLVPESGRQSASRAVQSIDVYELCLKGRFHARERTSEGLQRSIVCFERAIALDNTSSSAYAGLADTYTLMSEHGFGDGPECMVKAKDAAEHALRLNPDSAEAFASLGLVLAVYDWSWKEAKNAFERSLALNPVYVLARYWYSVNYFAMLGEFERAHEQLEAAIKLDPLSWLLLDGRAFLRTVERKYDEAIDILTGLAELDPSLYKTYTSMGRAYLQKGSYDEAIRLLEKGLLMAGDLPKTLGALGQAYGMAGDLRKANHVIGRLHQIASYRPVPSTSFALVYLGLNRKEESLNWLEQAVDRRESTACSLKVHPAYDALRGESRFNKLLHRVGFMD